jgi:16S rRNA (cytosine1402-N4)-methyltransferase
VSSEFKRTSKHTTEHIPVLLEETISLLNIKAGDAVLDLTVGGGGHAAKILETTAPDGPLIGIDADPDTLEIARKRLQAYGSRVTLIHSNFLNYTQDLNARPPTNKCRAVLLDLGLSSLALGADHSRFSFLTDGPLDFRFDPTGDMPTAADIINRRSEDELIRIFREYGEEREAKRIAREIVIKRKAQPFTRIQELAELVKTSVRSNPRFRRIHPATKAFQALRIAVNDELNALEQVLPAAIDLLDPEGRIAVISYHSLEDRIVKNHFRTEARDCLCPPLQPTCTCGHTASLKMITRHPITPSTKELNSNPRSRSAKLRVAEKLP